MGCRRRKGEMKGCEAGLVQPEPSGPLVPLSLWYDTKVVAGCEVDRAVSGERSGGEGRDSNKPGVFKMEPQS